MVLHATTPKPFSYRRYAAALIARHRCSRDLLMRGNHLFKHLQIFGPFALPFPHLPSQRGN